MRPLVILLAIGASACVYIPSDVVVGGGVEFGLIAVQRSPPQDKAQTVTVSRLGGWAAGDGVGFGYFQSKTVQLDRDCRVVFVIENSEQLETSIKLINSTVKSTGGDICVAG